jgi:hypothetical protein
MFILMQSAVIAVLSSYVLSVITQVEDNTALPSAQFKVGQIVRHRIYRYRGVIVSYDQRPTLDVSRWEAVVGLPLGTEQPFYRVNNLGLYLSPSLILCIVR